MNRAEKAAQVEELRKGLTKSGNAILFAFAGLKVPQVTELRRQVRATRSSYRVVKNTLALRAAKGTPLEALSGHFEGATAVAFNEDNPVGLAKVLTREELVVRLLFLMQSPLRRLVTVLNGPVRNLAGVVKQIAEQKATSGAGETAPAE